MTTFTIEIKADINLSGEAADTIKHRMEAMLSQAIAEGLFTGDTRAEVSEYRAEVAEQPPCAEDEITRFLQGQMEDGLLDAASMPQRLARYGLMMPSDFVAEMQERAESTEA
jgi:hypothetical protein